MASQRPRREHRNTKIYQYTVQDSHWNLHEKRQLLAALKRFQPEDYEKIHALIPSKSVKGIEWFIAKLKSSIQFKAKNSPAAPIENWHEMACDLTYAEEEDHSTLLSTVMSLIAQYENHPPKGDNQPDYPAIYRYLAALLGGDNLPILGALESSVILDLLHGLVDVLSDCDTKHQMRVMKWKYELLESKVNFQEPNWSIKRIHQALQNDFSEFTSAPSSSRRNASEVDKNSLSGTKKLGPSSSQSHIDSPDPQASQSHTESPDPQSSQSDAQSPRPQTSQCHMETPGLQASQSHSDSPGSQISQSHTDSSTPQTSQSNNEGHQPSNLQSHTDSPGLKSSQSHLGNPKLSPLHSDSENPESESSENLKSQTSESNETNPVTTSESHTPQTMPIPSVHDSQPGAVIANSLIQLISSTPCPQLESTENTNMVDELQATNNRVEPSHTLTNLLAKIGDDYQTEKQLPPRRRRRPTSDTVGEITDLKKPKLFSINPFCIPVHLLKLKNKIK